MNAESRGLGRWWPLFVVAVSSTIAGRLVPRAGRWLTVIGLVAAILGLAVTAVALRHTGGTSAAWAVAGPLFLAGLGGGMVTSPNLTLSLENVPVSMAGAAVSDALLVTCALMLLALLMAVAELARRRSGREPHTAPRRVPAEAHV